MTVLATRGLGKTGGFLSTRGLGKGILVVAAVVGGSKNVAQFTWDDVYKDVLTPISRTMYVKKDKEPYLSIQDVELEIDGQPFDLAEWEPPSVFIREAPGIQEAIDRAAEKMGVSRRKAQRELFDLILEERKKVESVKQSLFNDDEEIIAILLATDDI